jgi:hypothetical protein
MTRAELPVLRAQLLAERQRVRDVVAQITALRATIGDRPPGVVELMAAAGFLHNVYNGIENCMLRLAHGIDESIPTGADSHRLLVDQMSAPVQGIRPELLPRGLVPRLDEYRRFRHAFRHMYFFDLDWARLRPLVDGVEPLVDDFESALESLLAIVGA